MKKKLEEFIRVWRREIFTGNPEYDSGYDAGRSGCADDLEELLLEKKGSPYTPENTRDSCGELREFLNGDSWYDEIAWHGIWKREGISSPSEWMREIGRAELVKTAASVFDHPALLAGCRRRWIVVCRYAGINAEDAFSCLEGD